MMAACKLGHYNEGTSDGGILEENHVVCEWLDVLLYVLLFVSNKSAQNLLGM